MQQKSVFKKSWYPTEVCEDFTLEIARKLQTGNFLAKLIASRVSSLEEASNFMDPKIRKLLPDPFHLLDMSKGVTRVIQAIRNREKICIFADYDVDGATSSALLKNVLRDLQVESEIYVPNRITEGYGPSVYAMQKIKSKDTKLVITVDCGSLAFEALLYAAEKELDVIVIDHHISLDSLPRAVAVINPNRIDESSNYKNLAAVGVSFLFAIALCLTLRKEGFFEVNRIPYPDLIKHLDIVALGTVCDTMSLIGLNRAFVKQGLKVAERRSNIGYTALCESIELMKPISSYHLSFMLGPRINAGGRIGNSSLGAELLSTNNFEQAREISRELNMYNDARKVLEYGILEEAHKLAKTQINNGVLFISSNNWHPGVIGIVASRLKEAYNKPVAIIAVSNSIGKGSCRSIKKFNFGLALIRAKLEGIVIASGGHSMAGGFSIEEQKLPMLQTFLERAFYELQDSVQEEKSFYDLELNATSVNNNLIEEVQKLEPFGYGNPSPYFKISDLFVLRTNIVSNNHIQVLFSSIKRFNTPATIINAIAFNSVSTELGEVLLSKKSKSSNLTVIGNLKENKWQNRKTVQLLIKDLIIN